MKGGGDEAVKNDEAAFTVSAATAELMQSRVFRRGDFSFRLMFLFLWSAFYDNGKQNQVLVSGVFNAVRRAFSADMAGSCSQ